MLLSFSVCSFFFHTSWSFGQTAMGWASLQWHRMSNMKHFFIVFVIKVLVYELHVKVLDESQSQICA
ncbi:hypothetical protein DAI22_11g213600 [Oryza sativa Japonica Group]|nr:hypothetical protein DAI22_11g213600 [Oryza sativa Japonica Group]